MELLSRESVILSIHDSVGLLIEFTFIVKKCSRNSCHDMNLNFPFHAPGFYHSLLELFPNQDLDIEDFNDLRPEGIFKYKSSSKCTCRSAEYKRNGKFHC